VTAHRVRRDLTGRSLPPNRVLRQAQKVGGFFRRQDFGVVHGFTGGALGAAALGLG
jgi:hypothetical protein